MNEVIHKVKPDNLTMSSREIADVVSSRHDSVKRAIERLAAKGVIELPPMVEIPTSTKPTSEYRIGKRDSYVVVAQLSPEFTAKLVDRWQELEAQAAPQIPTTLSGALRLAADQAEQIERQQKAIEAAQPAIRFLDKFVESKSTKSLREVAKVLGVKERQFIAQLEDDGILFRQSGNLLPIAHYHHKGYFEVKTGEANGHAYQQTRFTPDGITWIAKRFGLTTQEVA